MYWKIMIFITATVVLLGLVSHLRRSGWFPETYLATITFHDSQTSEIISNQSFRLFDDYNPGLFRNPHPVETRQTDSSGHIIIEVKKIIGSNLITAFKIGITDDSGKRANFDYTIPLSQLNDGKRILPKARDRRFAEESRKPITPPRLEMEVKKKT